MSWLKAAISRWKRPQEQEPPPATPNVDAIIDATVRFQRWEPGRDMNAVNAQVEEVRQLAEALQVCMLPTDAMIDWLRDHLEPIRRDPYYWRDPWA